MEDRRVKVFKSLMTGYWVVSYYSSSWAMVRSNLLYSEWETAIDIAQNAARGWA